MKEFLIRMTTTIVGKIVLILAIAGVVFGAGWLLKNQLKGLFGNLFGGLKIEQTANVVEQVKKITEFTTACYYEERVLKQEKTEVGKQNQLMSLVKMEADSVHSELVVLVKGKVRAGFDLSKVADKIDVRSDTVAIQLPRPEIFDVIVNPSDYEMYIEEGKWSHEEITALQADYRANLQTKAEQIGLLEKANTVGKERVENLFKSFGFSVVEVTLTELK